MLLAFARGTLAKANRKAIEATAPRIFLTDGTSHQLYKLVRLHPSNLGTNATFFVVFLSSLIFCICST